MQTEKKIQKTRALHLILYLLFDSISITDNKTEKIEKPKDEGPPPDPATAPIQPNKDTIIEINANNKGLGLFVVGGKTLQPPVVSQNYGLQLKL